jgi:energy-coupling factor transporter ATP-binding protein EcfA2
MDLTITSLSYTYPGAEDPAVDNVSAIFRSGAVTALMGPNGCGKTTLAALIMGLLKSVQGSVMLGDQLLSDKNLAEIGQLIGFVTQRPERQFFCESVDAEMAFGLERMGLSVKEIEARKLKYLRYFGLERYSPRFPFALSAGEKQRLAIAANLAREPTWLILDEVTSALDRGNRRALGDLLVRLSLESGIGILMITHDEKFAASFAESTIWMEKGRICESRPNI